MIPACRRGSGRLASFCAIALVIGMVLSACTKKEDRGETPTAAPQNPTATIVATKAGGLATAKPSAAATGTKAPASAITDANGQQISDGVCQVFIPDGWVDDGTGRGTSPSGARFVLFGGSIASDADWQAAANIAATPASGRSIASVDRTATAIRILYAGDKGFEYRARFGNRYCDFTVYRVAGAIPPEEQALWSPLLATLGPVQ